MSNQTVKGGITPRGWCYPVSTQLGNCNLMYIDGLVTFRPYEQQDIEDALWDAFTQSSPGIGFSAGYGGFGPCNPNLVSYKPFNAGILLFHQGSDHDKDLTPYGPNMRAYIEKNNLGPVIETVPSPNPNHGNKPGILYCWTPDVPKLKDWWNKQFETRKANNK